jgi:hypothetical protein
MVTRRDLLKYTAAAGAAMSLNRFLQAQEAGSLIRRKIPATGEELPIVGLGSSATFSDVASPEDVSAVRDVIQALIDNGGTVFDTAPGYDASEEVAGRVVPDHWVADRKVVGNNVKLARRGTTAAQTPAGRAQLGA